jgi:hypothetical protein
VALVLASHRLLEFPLHESFVVPKLSSLVPKSNLAEPGESMPATDELLVEAPIHAPGKNSYFSFKEGGVIS